MDESRRRALLLSGLAGAGVLAATGTAGAAAPSEDVVHVDTVEVLRVSRAARDGAVVIVAGYRAPGDGGGMTVRWDAASEAAHNGGTVIAPAKNPPKGRWLQLHTGVVDFRTFGHFDAKDPADAALDAMVQDPAVHRVEAHTDLLFTRRHLWHRSHIELDFHGHRMLTTGIEANTHDNPFGAVLAFRGTPTDTTVVHKLASEVIELTDTFPVPDADAFEVGQWWAVQIEPVAGGGRDERELQKLVEVTEIVDGTHIRVGYLNGWPLAQGRTLTWTRVAPVRSTHVRNLVFEGAGDDEYTGSHPVSYEYAVDCDVSGIHATGSFWPVIMRRWCTRFRTEQCSLKNPPTVEYGGAGYLTQQIYCLYGHITDCTTSNVRHLNDLTASAYCTVVNCHGDGDDAGGNPFTTHGQYEHDLLFDGNSGLMDIANSGAQWGISAKRITVRRHTCSWFTANTKITDLTLEDVTVIARPTFDRAGTLTVNADGAQLRGCTAKTFAVAQRSARSTRPTVISDCSFAPPAGTVLVQTPVTAPVHFVRCTFKGTDGLVLRGPGPVHFTDCTVEGAPDAAPLSVGAARLVVDGGTFTDTGLELSAVRDQFVHVTGAAVLSGSNRNKALLSRAAGPGTVTWQLTGATSTTDDPATAHLRIADGTNHYAATGCRFTGGRLHLEPGACADVLHTSCVEQGTTRSALPPQGDRVRADGNLLL
ncbi:peptidase C14 [Streptomyces sp. VRA16 Mangrove soil]|uniref:peptidase C14 n=1 Tax=Streptomyces sp. VRA16 Mangrove soil TaxID=2817434 RepID=UPI001A9FF31B|nr:peptidase C14 [Streptomyces sp. VRA16 Mangrove soil]MBO1330073.1 peptidase C14 [Streptomyces sp. VRA16 Mangrove soil]